MLGTDARIGIASVREDWDRKRRFGFIAIVAVQPRVRAKSREREFQDFPVTAVAALQFIHQCFIRRFRARLMHTELRRTRG